MNKIRIIIVSLFVISFLACNGYIYLKREDTNKSVIVRMNEEEKVITSIKLPFRFVVKNNTLKKMEFYKVYYEYGFRRKGAGIELYKDDKKISNYDHKVIRSHKSLNYFIYSRHITDSTQFIQDQLKPYVNKMLELNQDTLHVGTVAEFKERHPELFKMLTENDTISIRHLKGRNSGLGERIAIPANW